MILVDSGPLIAAAIADDRDHRRCVDMFAALHLNSDKLLVPQTVVAEVAYAIQKQGGTDQELLFLRAFAMATSPWSTSSPRTSPGSSSWSTPTGTSRWAPPTPR